MLMKHPSALSNRAAISLLAWSVVVGAICASPSFAAPLLQGDGPFGEERKILKQFDADENGRLEGTERDAAREELKKTPPRGRGGMRGPGGRRGGPGGSGGPGGPDEMERSQGTPGPKVAPEDVKNFPDAAAFDPAIVRTIFLEFDVTNWEEELELFHNTDAEVPATLTVDGKSVKGVGVHFRGASSYSHVPRGSKRSFNVSVCHTDPAARAFGQKTLNLLNSNGDSTLLSAILYSHLARGKLAAPEANFVQVVVNGESWGVFVSAQQYNKDFATQHWPTFKGEGYRWKVHGSPHGSGGLDYRGSDVEEYRARYEIKGPDTEEAWSHLIGLCRMLSNSTPEDLEKNLPKVLNIDETLWFIAFDIASGNSDGYWTRASDYSIYLDPQNVFHVFPHDMNEAFRDGHGGPRRGPEGPGGPDGPRRGPPPGAGRTGRSSLTARGAESATSTVSGSQPDPMTALNDPTKPLRSALLRVPAWREQYAANLKAIATLMASDETTRFIARERDLIKSAVAKDTRKATTTESFLRETSVDPRGPLLNWLDARAKYLLTWAERESNPKPLAARSLPVSDQK